MLALRPDEAVTIEGPLGGPSMVTSSVVSSAEEALDPVEHLRGVDAE